MVRIDRSSLAGILAMVAVLLFTLTLASSGSATAAPGPVIDPTSCTVSGACDGLDASTVIGANSCNAEDACDNLKGTVGAGSCTHYRACVDAGASGGSVSIGGGSCLGQTVCEGAGFKGSASIGAGSCSAESACYYAGASLGTLTGSATVGAGSCNGFYACNGAGTSDANGVTNSSFRIGAASCNGFTTCFHAGYNGAFTAGTGSCDETSACTYAGGSGGLTVGNYACNGYGICYLAGGGASYANCTHNTGTPEACNQVVPAVLLTAYNNLVDSDRCTVELRRFLAQVRGYWRLGVITDTERDNSLASAETLCPAGSSNRSGSHYR